MNVSQLSVLLGGPAEGVSEVTHVLGAAGVNIKGFSVSDKDGLGVVRLIVDAPGAGYAALATAGFTVWEEPVLCLDLPDHPGGLAGVLKAVSDAGVAIEYVYSLLATYAVINVADTAIASAQLSNRPVTLISQEDVATI